MAATGALALACCWLLILSEVLLRMFGLGSTQVAEEYAGYLLATMVLLGAGQALTAGRLIRVSLLRERCGPRGRQRLDRIAYVATAVFAGLLVSGLALQLRDAWTFESKSFHPSHTPLWIPYLIVTIGAAQLLFSAVAKTFSAEESG